MNNQQLAKQIIKEIRYATLATVSSKGEAWNTPVFYVSDEHMNLYWSSHPESVHSQNIDNNNKVFVVIYNSKAGEGEGQGLYIETEVEELNDTNEIRDALDRLGERRGRPFLHIEKFKNDGPQRIYRAKPTKIWLNDADQDSDGDFIRDYRIEVKF